MKVPQELRCHIGRNISAGYDPCGSRRGCYWIGYNEAIFEKIGKISIGLSTQSLIFSCSLRLDSTCAAACVEGPFDLALVLGAVRPIVWADVKAVKSSRIVANVDHHATNTHCRH